MGVKIPDYLDKFLIFCDRCDTTLIEAYNKIHDQTIGEQHFQFYQKVGKEAFKTNKREIKEL